MVDLNRDLHAAIGHAGKNPYFAELYSKLLDEACRLIRLHAYMYDDKLPTKSVQEHVDLLQAINDKDADRADEIGRMHALELTDAFVRFLSANTSADVDLSLPWELPPKRQE
jgi:DNA-binding GntR family transcriptional regulator